ncbi:MAG: hypothetical protein JJU46_00645 [Balneolaceae bacterium]|nr:hypothetical protein [Balneolaceae bacterium]MCH8547332.1 hypothetical protein [Balneolaceae bacterium]
MNTLLLQGTSPVIPIIVITILAILSLLVAWWSYSNLDSTKPWKRYSLIACRASAFLILLLLLINPYLVREYTKSEVPTVAVYLDDSQSLSVTRGEYDGLNSYNEILERFRGEKDERFNYRYYLFAEDVVDGDDLTASGSSTNIHNVMEHIRENEHRYVSSLLFSDGIVTRGRNPVFAAQNLSNPLFTVPVGDTTTVRDIAIADTEYGEPVYTNTRATFTADIRQQGFEGEEVPVRFLENGELIESKQLAFPSESSSHQLEFIREYEEPGIYDIEIQIPSQEGEFTDENNTFRINLEVIDDQTQIFSLAFEVHPDVRAIRNFIATDRQNELTSSTWLGGDRFTGTDPRELEVDPDLIVLHGLPSIDNPVYDWLINREEPILYISTPSSHRYHSDQRLAELTGYRIASASTLLNVHIAPISEELNHPLLEISRPAFHRFPTLSVYRGSYDIPALSQQLLMAEFQRNSTDIPVMMAAEAGNRRTASINAFGWYRYAQSNQDEVRSLYRELFGNLIAWTSTPPDRRTLVLEPRRSTFTENEPVEIRGTLQNERGEAETGGLIELRFYPSEDDEPQIYRMNHTGGGVYQATLGSYPRGLYRVEGTATLGERELGEAETRVNVSSSNLELVNTRRDDATLRQLASVTGGRFLIDAQFDQFNDFISEQNLFEASEQTVSEIHYIHRSLIWFLLILSLLTVEWLIRRSVSLP